MTARAKELDMPALAITDHGVMFGAMEFYYECLKADIKPIIGMEAYVAPDGHTDRTISEKRSAYHLLLLAKNEEGYRNLCRLHAIAALEGFYYKPRIDHDLLRKYGSGIISSTTCLGSEVNRYLADGDYDKAQYTAGMYKEIFDDDCYFVELQDHGIPLQRHCNEQLLKIAKELHLPIAATNDAHFLCKSDAEPHDVLLCIGLGREIAETDRMKFQGEEYIKSRAEMAGLFPDHPEAIENTLMIADMVDLKLGSERAMMPEPDLEGDHTSASYLRHLAEKGLPDRIKNPDDEAWERLNFELDVIGKTGYDAYFLLVREFSNYARHEDIAFGVRGSAAGSLVAYTLGITDVDPIDYGLTFERFLNPERVSMPDVDMDFEDSRRDEVIKWVTEKYGKERVAQIVTFGTLGPKAAIRDSARVMGYEPREADLLCKAIPTGPGWSIKRALGEVGEFKQMVGNDPRNKQLVETAQSIEGLSRHSGVHAAGVVIAKEPLQNIIPLYRGSDNQAITAYEMGILEKLGLLKMDFLGLSNLTVLSRCIATIREGLADDGDQEKLFADHPVLNGGIYNIPLDDAKSFEMLGKGDTTGVFQLESGGMQRNIMELKPQNIRELAAMIALYRPGPMAQIPTYIANKFGEEKPVCLHESMEPILEETFGVIVYQDQVMMLVRALAGFTLGKADLLRKAMGKKNEAIMAEMKPEFFQGCVDNNVTEDTANKVWELLLPFAGYAFNKAHSVCYAFLAYQTAYLKANYPEEYLAALLSSFREKEDRVIIFIEECRRKKIPVLSPDVNCSTVDFTMDEEKGTKAIRFGLGAIKGVGEGLVRGIIEERNEAPFEHLYEFAERIRPHGLNKGSLEALIKAGALLSINKNRQTLLDHLEPALSYADLAVRAKMTGQDSLFDGGGDDGDATLPTLPESKKMGRTELLAGEKQAMGIYVSDHPLRGLERTLSTHAGNTCTQIQELAPDSKVKLAGIIAGLRNIITRKGARMAEVIIEDFTGQTKCMVFPSSYEKFSSVLEKDAVVVVTGSVSNREGFGGVERPAEVRVHEIKPMPQATDIMESIDPSVEATIIVRIKRATKPQLLKMKSLIESSPGSCEVVLHFIESDSQPVVLLNRVAFTREFAQKMKDTLFDIEIELIGELEAAGKPQDKVPAAQVG
jgi:DNA polymerase-3 subunit alpha